MQATITPGRPLRGVVTQIPGDKSITHRAILFGALAKGRSRLENLLMAGVTLPLINALTSLGVDWELDENSLVIHGRGAGGLKAPVEPLDCGNSATALRLLAGTLAAAGVPAVLDGSPGLRRRPMDRIIRPLQQMGVDICASEGDTAPLTLGPRPAGQKLKPLDYTLQVASAQVKSCLLLASLAASGPTTLTEPGPSRDHTERMLAGLGLRMEIHEKSVRMTPPANFREGLPPLPNLLIPGDFSAAAFLIVAALVTPGSEVIVSKVGLNPTRTGLLDALKAMGADIHVQPRGTSATLIGEPQGDISVRYSKLHGVEIQGDMVVRMIDEVPIFAVAAAFAEGPSRISNAEELRYKESDRITALCTQLQRLGVDIQETNDGFRMQGAAPLYPAAGYSGTAGATPQGGVVDSGNDHRLAMALAVAGLGAADPIQVQRAEISDESFPDFFQVLERLGARIEMTE